MRPEHSLAQNTYLNLTMCTPGAENLFPGYIYQHPEGGWCSLQVPAVPVLR